MMHSDVRFHLRFVNNPVFNRMQEGTFMTVGKGVSICYTCSG